jgi:LCP family protein required for cell wall assembly
VQKPILPSIFGDSSDAAASGDPNDPDELEDPDYDPVQPKVSGERKSEDYYTVLVFGADESSGLTDTIMLVSYDVTNQKATVMSIPRDTLTNSRVTDFASKKINAVYKRNGGDEKGIEALKNEVSELVGFTPDYYVMINWELVGQMVDAIGGVYFDIPYNMDYDDPTQDLYIHFDKGYTYLNGEDAMRVVRWRKNNKWSAYKNEGGGSDIGRLNVQHDFLKAVLKQTLQIKNLTKINQLATLFGENVESDLSIENMYWFAVQAITGGLNLDDVEFVTMPFSYGSYVKGSTEYSFVYPNQSQLLTLINESLNPYVQDVTIKQLDLMSVASDGSLRSSTGVLADSTVGVAPSTKVSAEPDDEDDEPVDTQPVTSREPVTSDSPQPAESDEPVTSDDPEPEPSASEEPAQPSPEPTSEPVTTTTPEEPEE